MKAYKGFNKDMTCRGFQYEEGNEYTTDTAELCSSGFHACENPLDCFSYYNPGNSVYHEVELDATDDTSGDDSKRVGKRIKIGARLDVAHICKAHFEYVKEHTVCEKQGKDYANLSAQNRSSLSAQNLSSLSAQNGSSLSAQNLSSLSAQNRSSLSAQDWSSLSAQNLSSLSAQNLSSLSAQNRSSLSAGKDSVLAAFNSKAKAGMGSLIALATREWVGSEYKITGCKAAVVDGITLKPDTWYTLEDGEFVEVDENE
jgi:hypothetical protein